MYKEFRTFKNDTVRIITSVFLTAGVMAQEEEAVSTAQPAEAYIRGDMVPQTPEVPGKKITTNHSIKEKREIFDLNDGKLTMCCSKLVQMSKHC